MPIIEIPPLSLDSKNENELAGIPLDTTLTYTGDQLTSVLKGDVTKSLTYDVDGNLETIDDGTYTQTLNYTTGLLTSVIVTTN